MLYISKWVYFIKKKNLRQTLLFYSKRYFAEQSPSEVFTFMQYNHKWALHVHYDVIKITRSNLALKGIKNQFEISGCISYNLLFVMYSTPNATYLIITPHIKGSDLCGKNLTSFYWYKSRVMNLLPCQLFWLFHCQTWSAKFTFHKYKFSLITEKKY